MSTMEIIRDPLWNNVAVDPLAMRLVDSPAFQRLRYVRQLCLAFLVYPRATRALAAGRAWRARRHSTPRLLDDPDCGAPARHWALPLLPRPRGDRGAPS